MNRNKSAVSAIAAAKDRLRMHSISRIFQPNQDNMLVSALRNEDKEYIAYLQSTNPPAPAPARWEPIILLQVSIHDRILYFMFDIFYSLFLIYSVLFKQQQSTL